jgi:hypothetical protein
MKKEKKKKYLAIVVVVAIEFHGGVIVACIDYH